mmetsp:Transcript_26244/g.35034  ORF Transcript_26244/g.35034 Transcript_26244/m.35034 type:complete len:96 (+) Transcript_26244:278-565(+)
MNVGINRELLCVIVPISTIDLEQIELQTQVISEQQSQYLDLSRELDMPMVSIENRSEIEQFTNRFNNDRTVPHLTLFSNAGHLLCENVIPDLPQH